MEFISIKQIFYALFYILIIICLFYIIFKIIKIFKNKFFKKKNISISLKSDKKLNNNKCLHKTLSSKSLLSEH